VTHKNLHSGEGKKKVPSRWNGHKKLKNGRVKKMRKTMAAHTTIGFGGGGKGSTLDAFAKSWKYQTKPASAGWARHAKVGESKDAENITYFAKIRKQRNGGRQRTSVTKGGAP